MWCEPHPKSKNQSQTHLRDTTQSYTGLRNINHHGPPHKPTYTLVPDATNTHNLSQSHKKMVIQKVKMTDERQCMCICVYVCVLSPCSGGLGFFMSVERSDEPFSKALYREKTHLNAGKHIKTVIVLVSYACVYLLGMRKGMHTGGCVMQTGCDEGI